MMQRIADGAPAAFILAGAAGVILGLVPGLESVSRILPYPYSIAWLACLALGSAAVIIGIGLRRARTSRRAVVGQGLEFFGNGLAGGMLVTYALVLVAVFGPFGSTWLTIWLIYALASAFIGPWAVILRDLWRAWKEDRE